MFRQNSIRSTSRRRGLTLAEMMIAMTLMVMISGAMLALATTVESGATTVLGQDEAALNARVVIDRIQRTVAGAHANENFPGCIALSTSDGNYPTPNILIVWSPDSAPSQPNGMPLWSEITIYTYSRNDPNQLLEIRFPWDYGEVPGRHDTTAWSSELPYRTNPSMTTEQVSVLTTLLRTASDNSGSTYGAVRFHTTFTPSISDYDRFKAGTVEWHDLAWPQGLYGSTSGTRQSWCRFELQLHPGEKARKADPTGDGAIPFFGSAAVYYQLPRY